MYCFLIASLPELSLETPAPMTVQEFDTLCSEELDQEKMTLLTAFDGTVAPDFCESKSLNGLYNAYGKFELYLRNRIARQRAEKAGRQLELPEPPESYSEFDFIAGASSSGVAQRLTTGFGGSKPCPGLEEEAGHLAGLLSEAGIPARGSSRGPRQARRRQPRARG